MITPLIRQIQSQYLNLVSHYPQNVRTNKKFDPQEFSSFVKDVESKLQTTLSQSLVEFLQWSTIMPIWKTPFWDFTEAEKDVFVWAQRAALIEVYLNKDPKKDKLVLLNGYVSPDLKNRLFVLICVDTKGGYTGVTDAIFAEYGAEKEGYGGIFKDPENTHKMILAENLETFLAKYVAYLKSLPLKKKTFKKIDRLLDEPKKLFGYVSKYNWDDGEEEMEYIVSDPRCELATALLIYWSSQPYFCDDKTMGETNAIGYIVEKNVRNNFYKPSKNAIDSVSNQLTSFIREYENARDKGRDVPDFILKLSS